MCLRTCRSVCVLTNKRGLQIWRQPWLLLFALFIKRRWADGLLVCCAVHTCGPTHPHANTNTHMRALSCHLSFILHLSFPLHVPRQDNATLFVRLRETERIQGSVNEVANRASEVVIWKSWWLTRTLASVNHCYSLVSRPVISKNLLVTQALFSRCLSTRVQETKHGTFGQGRMSKNLATAETSFTSNKIKVGEVALKKWEDPW